MHDVPLWGVEATAAAGMGLIDALPPPGRRDAWALSPRAYEDVEEGTTKLFRYPPPIP